MHNNQHFKKLGLFITLFSLSSSCLLATDFSTVQNISSISEISAEESKESIDYSQYITDDLLLPRNLYILKGSSTEERLNIFYRNALLTLSSTYNVSTYSPYGSSIYGRWLYKS